MTTKFAEDHKKAAEEIEKKKGMAIVDNKNNRYKAPEMYPIAVGNAGPPKGNSSAATAHKLNKLQSFKGTGKEIKNSEGEMTGAVVPIGFEHFPFCACY